MSKCSACGRDPIPKTPDPQRDICPFCGGALNSGLNNPEEAVGNWKNREPLSKTTEVK